MLVKMITVRLLLLTALLAAVAGGCRGSRDPEPTPSALRQACVLRWNWMHYAHYFADPPVRSVRARVQARPCRIEIDYRITGEPTLRGTYFPCSVNTDGAYVCAEHAFGSGNDPARTGRNADYIAATGRIELDDPPAQPVSITKPGWVQRYPVVAGFIEPFDASGRLRAGLRWATPLPSSYRCLRYGSTEHSRLLGCGAGLYCFVPRLPVYDNEPLACPAARGSREFLRSRLHVLPAVR